MNKEFLKGEFNMVQIVKLGMIGGGGLLIALALWRVITLMEQIIDFLAFISLQI